MDVPPEVLIVSMRTHQRYFVTNRKDGALANRFVVVANNVARDGGKTIVDGNERVLRSRLADAKFFWDQDRKVRLEERLPALKDIVFHAKLGTQADRVARIEILADKIAPYVAALIPPRRSWRRASARPTCGAAWSASSPNCKASWAATTRWKRSFRPPSPTPSAITMRRPVPNDRCPSAPVSDRRGAGRQARYAHRLLGDRREADRLARSFRAAPRGARHHSHRRRERPPPAVEEVLRCRRPDGLLRRSSEGADAREGRAPRRGRCRVRPGRRGRSRAPAGAGRGGAVVPRPRKRERICSRPTVAPPISFAPKRRRTRHLPRRSRARPMPH